MVGDSDDVFDTFYLADTWEISYGVNPRAVGTIAPPSYPFQRNVTVTTMTLRNRSNVSGGTGIVFTLLRNGVAVPGASITCTGFVAAGTVRTVTFNAMTYGSGDVLDVQAVTSLPTDVNYFSATVQ